MQLGNIMFSTFGKHWFTEIYGSSKYWPFIMRYLKDREAWSIVVHGVAKNQTQLSHEKRTTIIRNRQDPMTSHHFQPTEMEPNNSFRVDSEFRYTLFPIFYSIVFVLGVIANSYVLWVFARLYPSKKFNEIKIFMVNLTMADLLFLVTLPLWIVYYYNQGDWILPKFLCNLAGCFFFINTYCSVAFLAVITYNRFQAVTRPIKTAQATTRKRGFLLSLIIWVSIVGAASYFFVLDSTNREPKKTGSGNITRCFEHYEKGSIPVLIIHIFLVFSFFLVFLIILCCNLVIIRTLLTQQVQMQRNAEVKRRALWMVCTVLAVFIICFVPHHLVQLPWTLAELGFQDTDFHQGINDAHQVTLCLLSTNCVLDPIIYCFLTKKFRKHLTEKLYSMRESRKCSRATSETGTEVVVQLKDAPIKSLKY